jgi:hypothetical protein
MKLTISALTPELWPDVEDLFGPGGASNGCWCMYWRIGAAYRNRTREKNKAAFLNAVNQGLVSRVRRLDAGANIFGRKPVFTITPSHSRGAAHLAIHHIYQGTWL